MWMIRTKVKMPEQYIGCSVDKSAYKPVHGRPAVPQKISGDVIEPPHFPVACYLFVP